MTVSTNSVRDLLDNVAADHLSDASIQANIDRFKRIVDDVKDPAETDTNKIDDAIRAGAVWLSYGTYIEGISQDLGNVAVAQNIKMKHFMRLAEMFINRISKELIDLDEDGSQKVGTPSDVMGMTTSEAYNQ